MQAFNDDDDDVNEANNDNGDGTRDDPVQHDVHVEEKPSIAPLSARVKHSESDDVHDEEKPAIAPLSARVSHVHQSSAIVPLSERLSHSDSHVHRSCRHCSSREKVGWTLSCVLVVVGLVFFSTRTSPTSTALFVNPALSQTDYASSPWPRVDSFMVVDSDGKDVGPVIGFGGKQYYVNQNYVSPPMIAFELKTNAKKNLFLRLTVLPDRLIGESGAGNSGKFKMFFQSSDCSGQRFMTLSNGMWPSARLERDLGLTTVYMVDPNANQESALSKFGSRRYYTIPYNPVCLVGSFTLSNGRSASPAIAVGQLDFTPPFHVRAK